MKHSPKLSVALAGLLLAGVASFGMTEEAQATGFLRLTSGADSVTITDNGAGDSSGVLGVVSFSGALGGSTWQVNVTTGITTPVIGNDTDNPRMDLNSVNVSTSTAGTLVLEWSATDFNGMEGVAFTSGIGGTTDGSVLLETFLDASNTAFGQATQLTSQGPFAPVAFASTVGGLAGAPTSGQYSLTQKVTITHTAGGQISSFDAELTGQVPEPGTVFLFGTGLAGLGLWNWKRKKA